MNADYMVITIFFFFNFNIAANQYKLGLFQLEKKGRDRQINKQIH